LTAPVSIRSFREADRPQLVQLWTTVFPGDPPRNAPQRMIDGKLDHHPELLLVAEVEGLVVGAVIAGFDGVRGWIYHLAVAPAHRRRGIATRLMRAAEGGLRGAGCAKINLQVRASNGDVVAFYRTLGYELEERISMGRALD
jgi:ribosomal protein S18 acetylase RimI-like enzyme